MRFIPIFFSVLVFALLNTFTSFGIWSSVAVSIWLGYVANLIVNLNRSIAFREYILVIYGLNYIFSPALTYELTQQVSFYKMRLSPEEYFPLAIPALFCLHAGLYVIKTKIFTYSFDLDKAELQVNQNLLKQWLIGGVLLSFVSPFLAGDIGFAVYLLSGVRYLAAFGLFIIDKRKYKWYLFGILFIETVNALRLGMFHDLVVWVLFFGLLWTYLKKPSVQMKFVLTLLVCLAFFVLQITKATYRQQLSSGNAGFSSFSSAVSKNTEGAGLFSLSNFALSVSRANQGWIFASSVSRANVMQNFQGMNLVSKYAEAALLPRVLAPNKLVAGDKTIFNTYSGYKVKSGTSMALGLFADGYISYGKMGTFVFAFLFGILCGLVFKIIGNWTSVTPFFALFFFPIMNYAVRADCETQAWMGHMVKGVIVFGILVHFAKKYFRRKLSALDEEEPDQPEVELGKPLVTPTI